MIKGIFRTKGSTRLMLLWAGLLCVYLFVSGVAIANGSAFINVTDLRGQLNLAEQVQALKDPERRLSVETLTQQSDFSWTKQGKSIFDPSYENTAWWLRFTLVNEGNHPKNLILEMGWPLLDLLDVYVLNQSQIESEWKTGDQRTTNGKPIASRSYAFPISIPGGESREVLIRIDLSDSTYDLIPINLYTSDNYHAEKQIESLLIGAYFGAMLALLIYNFMIYCISKEQNFLFYAIYLTAFFIFNLGFLGYGFQYFWKDRFFINSLFGMGAVVPLVFSATAFVASFLETRIRTPKMHKLLWALSWLSVTWLLLLLLDIMGFSIPMHIAAPLLSVNIILLGVAYTAAGILTMRQGFQPAKYFILAWSFPIIGIVVYQLSQVPDLLPDSLLVRHSVQLGSVCELLLLSIAIGNKYKLMRDESLEAVRQVSQVQSAYAKDLEDQVREQTSDMREALLRIERLARTDALTQLLNRRAFNEILEHEIARANRLHSGLALCVLDIDDFKGYNDFYGHLQGDEVLRKVSHLMLTYLRRPTDFSFRIGGEEFAIFITDLESVDDTRQFIETLQREIVSLNIPHAKSTNGFVTASFGLVIVQSCESVSIDWMHALADEALYEAKSAGKNRVVSRIKDDPQLSQVQVHAIRT